MAGKASRRDIIRRATTPSGAWVLKSILGCALRGEEFHAFVFKKTAETIRSDSNFIEFAAGRGVLHRLALGQPFIIPEMGSEFPV
ncbi:hypothetical protein J2847_005458 [Azospirillum agricola]|nr:hypothetical protein [Azospirillum agricola]